MSLIFQELQQLEGELEQADSPLHAEPLHLEEDEFLRCMAFKAASMAEPVNAVPVEEPLWSPDQRKEFFSPGGSYWVANGWSSIDLPDYSADLQGVSRESSTEDCFFDRSSDQPRVESERRVVPHGSLRPMVNRARTSDDRAKLIRRERSQGGVNTGKNVNVVTVVAIGLMAVSFAMGLAQSRSGARVRR